MLLFGGPLVRIALATGRLSHRLQGRQAVQPVQMLVRLTLALVLIMLAARAAGWIFAETFFGIPEHALDFRTRELTTASTAWHTTWSPPFWIGIGVVAVLTGMLFALCRRRRLAGLSWIAGWVLGAAVVLMLLGLVVGYSLPGAGALAAMVAPVDWHAALRFAFWGDAAAITMLGLGAQTAVLTAAGRGLPQRAAIGREARILVAGITFLTVLGGLVGLLLLCALCVRQGIVPGVEHAAPGVLLLELVPALGKHLFPNWPEHLQPSERQITLAWCFLVALACSLGAAALLASRRFAPSQIRTRSAIFGFAAALVAALAVGAGWMTGTNDAWLPLATLMPALLAVMHLTLTRRAGTDLRVVANAFTSSRAWLESAQITFTFRFLRPVLLLLVLAVALSRREYGLVLGGFALSFALMWIGSLRGRPRSRETGMLRAVAAGMVLVSVAGVSVAQASPADAAYAEVAAAREEAARQRWVARFETLWARGNPVDLDKIRQEADALLAIADAKDSTEQERRDVIERARAVVACLLVADPTSDESLRVERALLNNDGLIPYARVEEAVSDHLGGRPESLVAMLSQVNTRLGGDALPNALENPDDLPRLLLALVSDMRDAYGAGGREAQRLRAHLLQRATPGRTLLTPNAGPGVVYIATVLAAAFALALALTLGVGIERRGTPEVPPPRS
jgi:hypothetical protein